MIRYSRSLTAAAVSACAGVVAFGPAEAPGQIRYDTVALSTGFGLQSNHGRGPNVEPGVDFNFQYFPTPEPVINNNGDVAFVASLTGPGVDTTNFSSVWRAAGGTLAPVVRQGDPGPSPYFGPGDRWAPRFINASMNDAGAVAFTGFVEGPGANVGIWTTAGGSLAPAVRSGDPVPGADAGVTFRGFRGPSAFADNGHVAVNAQVQGAGVDATNDNGIFAGPAGAITTIAREGPAGPGPNLGSGIYFEEIPYEPVINAKGEVAFHGRLGGIPAGSVNRTGIWSTVGGTLNLVAYGGREPVINDAGTVAFTNTDAVFTNPGGTLTAVARAGAAGPGPNVEPGVTFNGFFDPVINANDEVAFRAALGGAYDPNESDSLSGIWTNAGGSLAVVARAGRLGPGPGLGEGVVFKSFFGSSYEADPVLNVRGDVAFLAEVTGTGITDNNNRGLWVKADGALQLVAREGDLFDVDPGPGADLRTIFDVDMLTNSGGGDGPYVALNDQGQLAFGLTFLDGSGGVFTALVPEPSAAALLVGGASLALLGRRRRRQRWSR